MQHTYTDLLELFRMEVGQATLHEEDTDIRHFFEDCFQVCTYVYSYSTML
jgi:hypothetical protein